MAEAAVDKTEGTEETEGKKGGVGKLLFLGLNGLLFLAGAAFFVLTKFGILGAPPLSEVMPKDGQETAQQEVSKKVGSKPQPCAPAEAVSAQTEESVLVGLSPFIVNLRGSKGRRYLSVTVQVEVADEERQKEVQKHLPKIRNRMIFLLSNKTLADVSTPEGKYELQDDITRNLNEVLGVDVVKKIFFTNFVVQ